MSPSNRREFLSTAAAGAAIATLASSVLAQQEDGTHGLPTRPLGKTGEKLSIIALGGWHIGSIPDEEAVRIMHEAIDEGIRFFDNAWDYHDGHSEEVMGKALSTGGRRNKVFLMTKNCARDREGSIKHLDDSLRRLATDHLDLWQFHEINYDNDPDWIFDRGCLAAALEAQKAGKVRYIGFTGHKHPDIHLKMLGKPYDWQSVQMPINVLDAQYRSFQNKVVPECNRRQIGVLGMKALGGGAIAQKAGLDAVMCRRWALSLPITSLVCGIASRENLKQDVALARNFKPLSDDEKKRILADTKALAGDGRFELFKSTQQFDGPYHRKQHDLA